jgi:hypothetical protein
MRTSFLDYYKLILDKVSFDQDLFRKEYQKAKKGLMDHEWKELNQWLLDRGYPSLLYAGKHPMEMYRHQSTNLKNSTV